MSALLDLNHLMLYVGEDTDLRDEILSIYKEQLSLWLTRLSAQMSDEDWYQANHTLKGASRGVGAWAIGDVCEQAEALKGSETLADRETVLETLRPLCARVLEEVEKILTPAAAA